MDPATRRHLLSIPAVLQSVSPTIAAVHLARARLLLSISTHEQLFDGWCHSCGGLREGIGGTSKKRRKGASTVNGTGVKRKAARCTICGESFKRAQPDLASKKRFPSARIARRNQLAAGNDVAGVGVGMDPNLVFVTQPPNPPCSPPSLSRATISQLLTTPPTPPTYNQPAPLVPLEKKGTRKKKKSGLAKLLAENRERTEREQVGGSWGLR